MATRALDIVLIGPPGAGKGTQGRRIAEAFELSHLSTGDLLRNEIARGSELGQEARAFFRQGQLVPDELIARMVLRWLHSQPGAMGCVFDGYPRTARQATLLDGLLAEMGRRVDAALLLDLPDGAAVSRLKDQHVCGQCGETIPAAEVSAAAPCPTCGGDAVSATDSGEALDARLTEFRAHVDEVVDHFRVRGVLRSVSAEGSEEAVFDHLRHAMESVLRP